jgi:hypothetical protein
MEIGRFPGISALVKLDATSCAGKDRCRLILTSSLALPELRLSSERPGDRTVRGYFNFDVAGAIVCVVQARRCNGIDEDGD